MEKSKHQKVKKNKQEEKISEKSNLEKEKKVNTSKKNKTNNDKTNGNKTDNSKIHNKKIDKDKIDKSKTNRDKSSKTDKNKSSSANNNKYRSKEGQRKKSLKKKIISLISIICLIVFIGVAIYFANDFITSQKDKGKIREAQEYMNTENENYNEQVEKLKQMQESNNNIKSWIKIDDTKINYPVLQGNDNEYYLNHDYENNQNKYGSIFMKAEADVNDPNSNLIIYGHHMKDGEMFTGIMQYENKSFYDEHNQISLTTDNEVREYQVIAAFRSRVFYKKEKNVFRFYNYLKFDNEEKYNEYINNVKKIQLYDTGITASYGEQLMTLITCEYSQDNGRFVVVAKRIR